MGDALDLIAEAQARQRKAEANRDYWKAMAESKNRRCKHLVAMMRLRPLDVPKMHDGGIADWDQLMHVVEGVVQVFADPYARYPDDEDEYASLTHDKAKDMLVFRLQQMIEAAVARKPTK